MFLFFFKKTNLEKFNCRWNTNKCWNNTWNSASDNLPLDWWSCLFFLPCNKTSGRSLSGLKLSATSNKKEMTPYFFPQQNGTHPSFRATLLWWNSSLFFFLIHFFFFSFRIMWYWVSCKFLKELACFWFEWCFLLFGQALLIMQLLMRFLVTSIIPPVHCSTVMKVSIRTLMCYVSCRDCFFAMVTLPKHHERCWRLIAVAPWQILKNLTEELMSSNNKVCHYFRLVLFFGEEKQ